MTLRYLSLSFAIGVMAITATTAYSASGWSWNLGYHNPPGASFGLNFMHLWRQLAFEIGVGWVDIDSSKSTDENDEDDTDDEDTATVRAAGAMSLKYLAGTGAFRPYFQGGMGVAAGGSFGDDTGAGAGTGGAYFGGGLFLMASSFYVYASYNVTSGDRALLQGGLGFDL